nr:RNA-dependent RNA polymerase [Shahe heteroptera virus 3]
MDKSEPSTSANSQGRDTTYQPGRTWAEVVRKKVRSHKVGPEQKKQRRQHAESECDPDLLNLEAEPRVDVPFIFFQGVDYIWETFRSARPIKGRLYTDKPNCFNQSRILATPFIDESNIQLNVADNTVRISWGGCDVDDSASSIHEQKPIIMTADQMRSFPHDFTFQILSITTDEPLHKVFKPESDGYNNRTPDVVHRTLDGVLILEFTTHAISTHFMLERAYKEKEFKYLNAISLRVSNYPEKESKIFGFFPIVVSSTKVVCSDTIRLPQNVINELCARLRFARSIVKIATQKGLRISEDQVKQRVDDIDEMLKAFPEAFQEEGDCLVPLTKERVITTDVSMEMSSTFSRKVYAELLIKNLSNKLRDHTPTTPSEVIAELQAMCVSNNPPGTEFRKDLKSVLQVPGIIPPLASEWDSPFFLGETALERLWASAVSQSRTKEWMTEDSIEEMKIKAERDIEDDKVVIDEERASRRRYKRVRIPLDREQAIEFAKIGVQGKGYKTNPVVVRDRLWSKMPFHLDTEVDDISDFIGRSEGYSDLEVTHSTNLVIKILDGSLAVHKPKNPCTINDLMSEIKTLDLYHWCAFISDLATELCISIKQNVYHDEFILKKLNNWNCFVLIKPTNAESHIFYTILTPQSAKIVAAGNIAKPVMKLYDHYYTDWVSADISKLTNLVKAESFFISMLAQWCRHYGVLLNELRKVPEVLKMTKLCLLIHLEDRSKTEELFTLFRYISMEKFSLSKINDKKMLEKFPTQIRSRLQVWTIHKLAFAMSTDPYVRLTKTDSQDEAREPMRRWRGLINPYLGTEVKHVKQLIELYYLGYATNKDAKTWSNAEFKLVEKILKYEDELDKARPEYCGIDEEPAGDYRFHEWSRKMVCASADIILEHYGKLYSEDPKNHLKGVILQRLQRITWEQVATLKASSTYDPDVGKAADKNGKYTTKRVKAIIAVLRNIKLLADTPILSLRKIVENLDKTGGLRVDIFKKNQHGGLREIYVLDIYSRILQLSIEEIARALCDGLPVETMMNPELKLIKPQEHMYKSAMQKRKDRITMCSSNDAKVWNQGHHVAKFAQFLCRILPQNWVNFIVKALSFWTHKKIALPDSILNMISRIDTPDFYNPLFNRLNHAFKGATKERWISPGETHITIESGMMQGILHYTSSLFHCGMIMLRDYHWGQFMKTTGHRHISTDLVSSDDSSRMVDVFVDKDISPGLRPMMQIVRSDQMLIGEWSKHWGIMMSIKSTYCAENVMEFNSEFFIGASLCRPTIKWVYACLQFPEVESLVERQEIIYNLTTELLEGGSGFVQAFQTQVSMAFLHYRLLGVTSNKLSRDYLLELASIPDPSLGYFLMDNPIACGLSGFSYNLWLRIEAFIPLNCLYANFMNQGTITNTTTGQLTRATQIRYGNRAKTMKLIEESQEICPDWRERIEKDPILLYTASKTIEHSIIKILVKLTSPSVTTAMSKGNSVARMIASSVYLISGFATTIGSNWQSLTGVKTMKTSLWKLLSTKLNLQETLTRDQLASLFPQLDYFKSLESLYADLAKFQLQPYGSNKMHRSTIVIYPNDRGLFFSLENIIKYVWFGEPLASDKKTILRVWDMYKSIYPWLKDDPHSTLNSDDCHFEDQIQLRNFIARQIVGGRKIHLTGVPLKTSKTRDMIYEAITRNQVPGYTLTSGEKVIRSLSDEKRMESDIACILTYPLHQDTKYDEIVKVLKNYNIIWDGSDLRASSRRISLGILQYFIRLGIDGSGRLEKDEDRDVLMERIKISKLGVIGGFTQVQKQDEVTKDWYGKAVWKGLIGDAAVLIVLNNDRLDKIVTNSISKLRRSVDRLNNLMVEFRLNTYEPATATFENNVKYVGAPRARYNLKEFSTIQEGASVVEDSNLKYDTDLAGKYLKLFVSETHLRLVQRESLTDRFYTICSYKASASDFNFLRDEWKLDCHVGVLKAWISGVPEEPQVLDKLIRETVIPNKPTKAVDKEAFKDFFNLGFVNALIKMGLRPTHRSFPQIEIPSLQTLDLDPAPEYTGFTDPEGINTGYAEVLDVLYSLNDTLDDPWASSDDEPTSKEPSIIDIQKTDYHISTHQLLLGDLDIKKSQDISLDIKLMHPYWDNYVSSMLKTMSPKSRDNFNRGITDESNKKLTDILSALLGWEFKEEQLMIIDEPKKPQNEIDDIVASF